MKKALIRLSLAVSLFVSVNAFAQSVAPVDQKMSVDERMAKARAAKAAKKDSKTTVTANMNGTRKEEKATPDDYKTPVDKVQKGPNGEEVHTGERGGKYYINKNGNKTYLSSNQ